MGRVYSPGMQAALRRLSNQNTNLTRLTIREQKLADELLLQKIMGDKLFHEGKEYDLPPEREQQRILVLQLTEKI
jgi:hypothetical protein